MKNHVVSAILGLALAVPAMVSAQSMFTKELIVIPVRLIDANTFEAVQSNGAGGSQLWCAAGKFTRNALGQRGGNLTVLQARAPSVAFPGRMSVIFTTNPVANAVSSTSQGVRTAGQTFSMAHAYALCRSQPELVIKVRIITP